MTSIVSPAGGTAVDVPGGAVSVGRGRSLRVLHLAHARWFNAEVQYALDLAEGMQRRGHRVAFWGQTASPGVAKARALGLEAFEEAGFNRKGLAAVTGLAAAARLRRLLRARPFDAVEVHRGDGFPLIAWACRSAGAPLVRVRGDMRPLRRDPLNRFLHQRLLAAFVASNSAIAASCRRVMGGVPRLTTIPGGVDAEAFSPRGPVAPVREALGFPPGAFLVGILGRLGEVKGHRDLLHAVAQAAAASQEVHLVVLAKAPTAEEAVLRQRVAENPLLRGRVGFLGHQTDLAAALRAFDLGVVASVGSEANCRVGLEWMACGVPLLATRVGVLPDLVADGESGFLVSAGAPAALAEKIGLAAADLEGIRRMGRASRRRVEDQFTLAHCARAHEALLADVVGSVYP